MAVLVERFVDAGVHVTSDSESGEPFVEGPSVRFPECHERIRGVLGVEALPPEIVGDPIDRLAMFREEPHEDLGTVSGPPWSNAPNASRLRPRYPRSFFGA